MLGDSKLGSTRPPAGEGEDGGRGGVCVAIDDGRVVSIGSGQTLIFDVRVVGVE